MDATTWHPDTFRPGITILQQMLLARFGEVAVVSSFSAESAVLLALVAEIDPAVPVLFLDTRQHFAATLAYRDALTARLGLRDARDITPTPAALLRDDRDGMLHATDPDACCILRKVAPLEAALSPFAVWVTGRKRHQTSARADLAFVEQVDGRTKLNPLADWTAADIAAEFHRRGLPPHPLVAQGFTSIGCAPCTRAARDGEDARAGRWAGRAKTECGIHRARPAAMAAE